MCGASPFDVDSKCISSCKHRSSFKWLKFNLQKSKTEWRQQHSLLPKRSPSAIHSHWWTRNLISEIDTLIITRMSAMWGLLILRLSDVRIYKARRISHHNSFLVPLHFKFHYLLIIFCSSHSWSEILQNGVEWSNLFPNMSGLGIRKHDDIEGTQQ